MTCPKCEKHRLVAIAVTIGEDRLTMLSCSGCGTKWWERDGRRVSLPKVLELATLQR
jgi:transcription elongation factor Elf1